MEELTDPQGLWDLILCPTEHSSRSCAKASKIMIINAAIVHPATKIFMATTPLGS
jgi:hypothetical protein